MDNYNWNYFRNLSIPKNTELKMTVFKSSCYYQEDDDYVFLEKLDNTNKKEINIINEINLLNKNDKDYVEQYVCIDFNYFINDVTNSFKDKEDIEQQFKVDMPRCEIFINNHQITSPQIAIDFLNFNFNKNITSKVTMLTTQAFLGLPFQIIFKQVAEMKAYHLAEISSGEKDKRPYRISINITDNDINFKTYKEFRIFKLVNGQDITIYKVYIKIEFSINKEDIILMNIKISKNI